MPTTHGVRPEVAADYPLEPVESLAFYPGNARQHDDDVLTESLTTHGQYRPVVAQRSTRYVLAGNGTLHTAAALGWSHVAVSWLDVDDDEARRIVLMDNRASDLARDDPGDLAALLQGLHGDYTGTGFDDQHLAGLLAGLDEPLHLDLPGATAALSLADRFGVPPFSVLDARRGWWRERKREWLRLGIRSELGRDAPIGQGGLGTQGDGGMADQLAPRRPRAAVGNLEDTVLIKRGMEPKRTLAQGQQARRDPATGALVYEEMAGTSAVSVFDPVLCELVYRWFSAEGHQVIDPWAGGSVRGVVAAHLGRRYTGVELRPEQVAANRDQLGLCPPAPRPTWLEGDATEQLGGLEPGSADLLFGCPPYYGLERYSDDPRDLSTMTPDQFDDAMALTLQAASRVLLPNSFAVLVTGNVRHPSGRLMDLGGQVIRAAADAGLVLHNDAILVTTAGSLPVRAGRSFSATRVLGRTHQEVLVFVKGDRKKAAARCGTVEVTEALDAALADGAGDTD